MNKKKLSSSGNWGGYDGTNVYYNPESCGLKIVASADVENLDYEYQIALILQDVKTGSLWGVEDSGCSCPTPFEEIKSFADMRPIRSQKELQSFVDSLRDYSGDSYYEYGYTKVQKQELLRKTSIVLKRRSGPTAAGPGRGKRDK